MTSGDFAFDSCAQFLAVAEHRLIPFWARSICHQLRKAGHHSVWAPTCQDRIAGGHPGVSVVSPGGAPISLPSFVTPQFQEFFRLRRGLENHSSYCSRRSGSSFLLFMVIRERRRMLINCSLLIGFFNLSLLKLRGVVLVSPCLLLVI